MKYLINFCLAFLIVIIPSLAIAGDAASFPIDIQNPVHAAIAFIFNMISVGVGALIGYLKGKKGLPISDETETYLKNAILAGLNYAQKKAHEAADGIPNPQVKNQIIADTVNYVLGAVPALLVTLGISQTKLRDLVAEKLLLTQPRPNGG